MLTCIERILKILNETDGLTRSELVTLVSLMSRLGDRPKISASQARSSPGWSIESGDTSSNK
ncbi:hypothetical protein [Leptolyngbya sp. DQ-M1]|uniref:hypothetical protein n=1 Tax=Leptolyngbya sp. DQ-M1 TaxID=2933920 RepID=UPI00329A51CB